MRSSPRLNQHASGVILGVSQIINGLDDPVYLIQLGSEGPQRHQVHLYLYQQMVVKEVAIKFASSHFKRGVKLENTLLSI